MTIENIRKEFLAFFKNKSHEIIPSASMVIKNDPTLMFTNAGMNQFKDYFLGNSKPNFSRIANTQKCLRVSGKHNDLEEVGVDTYHHTMFEMLGNWSFGDYFKEQAINWAWELLTEVYKIDKNRLYVTVFEGDQVDQLTEDTEALDIWKKNIHQDRIIFASKKDNFWEMGEMGPCGPCTEIHVDIRNEQDRQKIDGKNLVNKDHPQVIEIWNLVFIQFNRRSDGTLEKLPDTHVDTGMGLERLAMVLQKKQSNYDIDLFQHLIQATAKLAKVSYGNNEQTDIALRVISDHIRAISFSIADGQLPSNNGAGYVIRRILRRAVRYGYDTLCIREPFLAVISNILVEQMGKAYPELVQQKELIRNVIHEEELSFFRTLEQGLKKIQNLIKELKAKNLSVIAGEDAFELYDTYGFPFDLTALISKENGIEVDEKTFHVELNKQKNRSRSASSIVTDDWVELSNDASIGFIGYDFDEAKIKITKYRKVTQQNKSFFQLVFNQTPFYPEGGGQIGDSGTIHNSDDEVEVFNTKKENNLIIHYCNKLPQNLEDEFSATINKTKRKHVTTNHTATHLLHHALRSVLGNHVEQKGSLVHNDYLRFDFSHFSKMSEEQLNQVQEIVSKNIESDLLLEEKRDAKMNEAIEMGAMALFGEKYGEKVRIIKFGESVELCGGTHVKSTREIGLFIITSESAVASGVRRIEAITSKSAKAYLEGKGKILDEISALLKQPKDLIKSVNELVSKNNSLTKELESLQKEKASRFKKELKNKISNQGNIQLLCEIIELDSSSIKDILFQLRNEVQDFVGVIGGVQEQSCSLSVIASDNIVKGGKFHAGNLVRESSKFINGGGGGQPFFATAGGKNPDGLKNALDLVKSKLSNGI